MRVVVAGSSGLIGGALLDALRQRGDGVVRLVRRAPGPSGPSGPSVPHEKEWQPSSASLDPAVLEGADAVVNLAGAGLGDRRWSAARRRQILQSRVDSTSTLARAMAALARPPAVLVNASAVGFYGNRGDEELTEDSTPGTGFLAEVCRAWEEATAPAADAGIRVVRLRSGVVLSRGGGALARQLPLFRAGLGGRLGDGRQWLSWISIADEIGAILFALDHDSLAGAVNATGPAPVTNRAFTAALGRALHRPAVLAVPGFALRIALGAEMADEMVLSGQRAFPARLRASGYEFEHPDIDAALGAVLGAA